MIEHIKSLFIHHTMWLTWQDSIEIVIISSTIYAISRWLAYDTHKPLIYYFYAYLIFGMSAHMLSLSMITQLLLFFSPSICMLFILMHQDVLQRNIVALKNISFTRSTHSLDWLTILIKGSLESMNNKKQTLILIEHTDALAPYLHTDMLLDVPITEGILSLILHKGYSPHFLLWVTSSGTIKSATASWKNSWNKRIYLSEWTDDAMLYTEKTDALFLYANIQDHHYTLIHQGTITEHLTTEHLIKLINKTLQYQDHLSKKGYHYGATEQKNIPHHSP